MYKPYQKSSVPDYLDDLDDCVDQNQESRKNQNDQCYLGDCVDHVYKGYQKSSELGYLDDLSDCVDQDQEN